jgi:LPXTG-site transpeptidase (sortase) family protein
MRTVRAFARVLLPVVVVLAYHPGAAAGASVTAGAWPQTTLEIPRIGVSSQVFEGDDPGVLARGLGHTPGTGLPGEAGNVVIPGHRTLDPHLFGDIDLLQPGDEMILTTPSGRFVYQVTGHMIVAPEDVWITAPTPAPTITIYACHPKGSERQRYVVMGRLVRAPAPRPPPAPPRPEGMCVVVCIRL